MIFLLFSTFYISKLSTAMHYVFKYLLMILMVGVPKAFACKDLIYSKSLTNGVVSRHSDIYVVKVESVDAQKVKNKSSSISSFSATVLKTYKGILKQNEKFTAHVYNVEGYGAACPIHLNSGKKYLLFMNSIHGQMLIARQSARYLDEFNPLYKQYLSDLDQYVLK